MRRTGSLKGLVLATEFGLVSRPSQSQQALKRLYAFQYIVEQRSKGFSSLLESTAKTK